MLNIIYLNSYDRVKYSRETIMDGAEGERATRNSQAKRIECGRYSGEQKCTEEVTGVNWESFR